MLVITRKTGETILIGDHIQVTITDIQKGKVKIAIEAPREVSIFRKELVDEVRAANIEAGVRGGPVDLDRMTAELIQKGKSVE